MKTTNYIKSKSGLVLELIRYAIVGGSSAITFVLISNLAFYLTNNSYISSFLGWTIALIVSYIGHLKFTFTVSNNTSKIQTIFKFMILVGLNFSYTMLLTFIAKKINLSYHYVSILITISWPLISYFIQKYFVFK